MSGGSGVLSSDGSTDEPDYRWLSNFRQSMFEASSRSKESMLEFLLVYFTLIGRVGDGR